MDRAELNRILELWAEYIQGGRALHVPRQSIMAAWIQYQGAPPRTGFSSKTPAIADDSLPEQVDRLVTRLHKNAPRAAQVLRTEYGLTRFYDTRSQLYRAAKLGLGLRTYERLLRKARNQIAEWLDKDNEI